MSVAKRQLSAEPMESSTETLVTEQVCERLASLTIGAPKEFLDLPGEIRLSVLDYIKAPSDLKSLCLTCKKLQAWAATELYRTITLPVNVINAKLGRSLNSKNRWLSHTKFLDIQEAEIDNSEYNYDRKDYVLPLENLLKCLPPDSLTNIRIDTQQGMSPEIDNIVMQTQRKLQNVVFYGVRPSKVLPLELPSDRVSSITALSLFIESEKDLARHTTILQKFTNLNDLKITICCQFEDEDQESIPTIDVIRALFYGNPMGSRMTTKLGVTRLLLDKFDFDLCSQDMMNVLENSEIKDLAMDCCEDM